MAKLLSILILVEKKVKSKGHIVNLHDTSPNPKCNCQQQITFSLRQFLLQWEGFKKNWRKLIKELVNRGINLSNKGFK